MKNILTFVVLLILGIASSYAQSLELKEDWAYVPTKLDSDNNHEGFIYRAALLCGPKIDEEKYIVQDTIFLYDVYAMKGKHTKILGIVKGEQLPYVVFELGKDAKILADLNVEEKIQNFINQYGWDEKTNFNFAFFPQQKNFLNSVIIQTTPIVTKKVGRSYCTAYDFHSQSSLFHTSTTFLTEVFREQAVQDFIDSQARKAHYTKSTKCEDLKSHFNDKDPETIEFVSKYLTWAGKWDKKAKEYFQKSLSKD